MQALRNIITCNAMPIIRLQALLVSLFALAFTTSSCASNEFPFPNAADSDPAKMGWMIGSPPPEDRTIRFTDGSFFRFPQMRWSVANFQQLMPTANVSRGTGETSPLPRALRSDLDNVSFTIEGSNERLSWNESLEKNYTDGIVILHRGKVIQERFFGIMNEEKHHAVMSITKSFFGVLASALVSEGKLDPKKLVTDYVPELAGSGFEGATVRQVLDMTTGIRFNEDYSDPKADIWAHAAAGNPLPKPADFNGPRTYYEFLRSTEPEGEHGTAFHYRTINSDALGWIIARASETSVDQLFSDRIWKKMGVELNAIINVDSIGTPFAGGGLSLGLRDLARFGEMLLNNGKYNGQQIIPAAAVADIFRGANKEDFAKAGYSQLKGWSYRNMWWVTHNEHGAIMARGVFGQSLYIDPKAEMVIARFGSYPIAGNAANDPVTLPAFHAMAKHLIQSYQK